MKAPSINEILEALNRAAKDDGRRGPADAWTQAQISKRMGWGRERTLIYLRHLKDAKKLTVVRVPCERVDGCITSVSGYRFVSKKSTP